MTKPQLTTIRETARLLGRHPSRIREYLELGLLDEGWDEFGIRRVQTASIGRYQRASAWRLVERKAQVEALLEDES